MQLPDPRKLDFWLWTAVIVIVLGATTFLTARWELGQRPAVTEHSVGQPRETVKGSF